MSFSQVILNNKCFLSKYYILKQSICKKMNPNKKEIKRVFDKISHDFSQTRKHPWPEVVDFIEKGRKTNFSLDLGCGNGRHMKELIKKSERVIGVDFSKKMLKKSKREILLSGYSKDSFELVQGDITDLPFNNQVFDIVICIATLHHIPSSKKREECLNEIHRVLKKNGRTLISVWSIEHNEFEGKREEVRKNNFDYFVDWKSDGFKEKRFYHIFNRENFSNLLNKTDFTVKEIKLSSGNYYAELNS
ncbi:hypothetical protein C9439_07250 [archaeon SCG-AAA382B04]|nr:hypothetical protein C9439_07250 [archaeon SCG-AAA382B04]